MDKGRNPHVIRTWAVDRIRQHQPVEPVRQVNPRGAAPHAPKKPLPKAPKG